VRIDRWLNHKMDQKPSEKPDTDPPNGKASQSPSPRHSGKRGRVKTGPYQMLGVGIELMAIIGGMTFAGYLVDRKFDTSPWGIFIGSMLGITVGCYNAVKEASRMQKRK